jgi:hypothetical protein
MSENEFFFDEGQESGDDDEAPEKGNKLTTGLAVLAMGGAIGCGIAKLLQMDDDVDDAGAIDLGGIQVEIQMGEVTSPRPQTSTQGVVT